MAFICQHLSFSFVQWQRTILAVVFHLQESETSKVIGKNTEKQLMEFDFRFFRLFSLKFV